MDPEVITGMHMAVGLPHTDELDPGPDLNATADSLFAHLCATNLITIGEALQLVLRSRTGDNAGRPRLHEVEPSSFSRCPTVGCVAKAVSILINWCIGSAGRCFK